jgi:ABC-type sugar transport system, periplasmic component
MGSSVVSRIVVALGPALMLAALAGGCEGPSSLPRIGVALYSVDDTFASGARRALESEAKGKARLSVLDGRNDQSIQSRQIDALFADKAKAVIVNPVDRDSVQSLVFKAKSAGVPIVFFNRQPPDLAVRSWDKAYFVGVETGQAELLQAEILSDYWKAHPEADRDGDGVLRFVALKGKASGAGGAPSKMEGALKAEGIAAAMLAEESAAWSRAESQRRMSALLQGFGSHIEAVFCENDEMALGAIDAMKVSGYFGNKSGFIPVVGADATRFALQSIAEGTMLGTVGGDSATQGRAAFDLAYALARGENPAATGWFLTEGKYVLIPLQIVTAENYEQFLK